MPFPWKKVKGTKISQLFSDHLESHRRQRGHLVVETGFPTSLVDLFVKNRDRLKKPKSSKKKKKKNDNSSVLISPSPSPSSSPLNIPRPPCPSPLVGVSSSPAPVKNGGSKETEEEETRERPNAKGFLGAILKLSFLVVFALVTKKFTVGLLMSVLLLLFMEFIGKKSYRFFWEPYSGVNNNRMRRRNSIPQSIFQDIIIRFSNKSFDDQKFNTDERLGSNNDHGDCGAALSVCNNPNCEIEIAVEPMLVGIQEQPPPPPLLLDQSSDGSSGNNKAEEYKPKKGKRAKMKSKIKRLFPRKFRKGSKKEKWDLEIENNNPTIKEDGEAIVSYQIDQNISLSTSTSTSTIHERNNETIITEEEEEEQIQLDGIITAVAGEDEAEEEEEKRKGKKCCGFLITCVIVLMAVTIWESKFLAIVLVISWFLILKSGEILKNMIYTYITHIIK